MAAHPETAHYARWLEAAQEFLAEPRTLVELRAVLLPALPS
ncbi:hypothetical protein AB0L59_11425 [Streptomyces sp. NPDC052109]